MLPIIEANGYEYVGTEFVKSGDAYQLIVYADKPGGLALDDCERISRMIEPVIDEKDPIAESYCLCVSSPGLDRPLKTSRDFDRGVGKKVDVKLYKAEAGIKEWTGTLKSHGADSVTVETPDGDKAFALKDVAIIRLHADISFGR